MSVPFKLELKYGCYGCPFVSRASEDSQYCSAMTVASNGGTWPLPAESCIPGIDNRSPEWCPLPVLVKVKRLVVSYCLGSGKPPKTGKCPECRDRFKTTGDLIPYHPARNGFRVLDRIDFRSVPCPTCKVTVGDRCLTIEPVQNYYGKNLGRIKTMTHRARKRLATRRVPGRIK